MNIKTTLEQRISQALQAAGAPDAPALVASPSRPEFGDYQANGCMAAAKKMKINPRQLAETVLQHLDLSDLADKIEIAGPGFINIFLKRDWLNGQLAIITSDEKLGVLTPKHPETVVVDYSGPNLAKEMHVGHLRSTIIGDALARTLQFIGYQVVPQNHVGDWGTQFGMLLTFLLENTGFQVVENSCVGSELKDLEDFYKKSKELFDSDNEFAERSRNAVVDLQAKKQRSYMAWLWFVDQSLQHCSAVYRNIGVLLSTDDIRGESFYNDYLPQVIKTLDEKGLLKESEGAKGVYLDEFKNKDDDPFFMIVQKSDGGYLYATTDLAAIWFRCGKGKEDGVVDWKTGRVLYVTDSRQAQHFAQVFTIAKQAGFAPAEEKLEHVPFGMMLGTDGKPFKTRQGGTVKLMDLLDEAEKRAADLVKQKNPELSEANIKNIAHIVGVGALKYADLSQNRTSDYVFSWDKMLSLEGNTAPYMQYAYARIQSIFRKQEAGSGEQGADDMRVASGSERGCLATDISITEPAERSLAVKLLQFPETVESVAETSMPNILCAYLYDLAGAFMSFYENCPVLKSEGSVRASRLALCKLAARVIRQGLSLLGIDVLEQM